MATMKISKQVQVIARIAFKSDPRKVVYQVRSSDGKSVYETSLFCGKPCSCTCPARKPCYHMVQLEAIEAARSEQLATAAIIAPLVLGKAFAADLPAHLDDELTNQSDPDGWTPNQQREWHVTNFLDVA